jgi:hypothetical protein
VCLVRQAESGVLIPSSLRHGLKKKDWIRGLNRGNEQNVQNVI